MPRRARPARRRRHRHAALVRPAAAVGAPRGGAAPAEGRGARRGLLGGGLRPALDARSSTSSSRIPSSSARSSCCTPPTSTPASCARSPWPSSGRGTSWKTSFPISAPTRPRSPTSCRRSTPSSARSPSSAASASTRPTSSSWPCTSSAQFAEVLAAAGADDLDLLEALGGLPGYRKNSGKAPSWRGCKDAVLAQLAVVVETVEAVRRDRARRLRPSPRARRCAPRPSRRPSSAGRRAPSSSTTCSSWPARCCATRSRARSCGPPSTSGTSGCCSTSSRTPTRSRSSSPCASRPLDPADGRRSRVGPTSRSRPGACSWSATRSSRSTGSVAPTSPCSWPRASGSPPRPRARSSSRPTSARSHRSSTG